MNMNYIKTIAILVMLFTGLVTACDPGCPPCQYWNSTTSTCVSYCMSGYMCCGGGCYPESSWICCNNSPYLKSLYNDCCYGEPFNNITHICCGTPPVERLGRDSCCSSKPFNSSTDICCAFKVYNKEREYDDCCFLTPIKKSDSICCNDKVESKSQYDGCCESSTGYERPFKTSTHVCCDGMPVKKGSPSDICCGIYLCDRAECKDCYDGICVDFLTPISTVAELDACSNLVADPNYKPVANGCGPEPDDWIPDNPAMCGDWTNFEPACANHDICYGTCGSDKEQCDDALGDDIYDLCNDMNILYIPYCWNACQVYGVIYETAVDWRGGDPYADAQVAACNCCGLPPL